MYASPFFRILGLHCFFFYIGPLLFLLFIDDISFLSLSYLSKLNLYADNILYYKVVSSAMDYVSLQQDINDISAGSTANLLSFNLSKCKFMLVSHKRHPSFPSP